MKIVFKNGKEIKIKQEVADTIRKRVIEGCANFQCFTNTDNGKVFLIVNLEEVSFITDY